jgi:hypothetical protein
MTLCDGGEGVAVKSLSALMPGSFSSIPKPRSAGLSRALLRALTEDPVATIMFNDGDFQCHTELKPD